MEVHIPNFSVGVVRGLFVLYFFRLVESNERKEAEIALVASERNSETVQLANSLLTNMNHGQMSYVCRNMKSSLDQERTDFTCNGTVIPSNTYSARLSEQFPQRKVDKIIFDERLICCNCPMDVIQRFFVYATCIENVYIALIERQKGRPHDLMVIFKKHVETSPDVVNVLENDGRRAAEKVLVASQKTGDTQQQAKNLLNNLKLRGGMRSVCRKMRSGFGQENVTSIYNGNIISTTYHGWLLEEFPERDVDYYKFTESLISCTCPHDAIPEFFVYVTYIRNEYIGLIQRPNGGPTELWIIFKKHVE